MKPIIVDAHLDIAYNMISFKRDYTRSISETRAAEAGTYAVQANGDTTVSHEEFQKGRIALVFSTLFAAPWPKGEVPEWETQVYKDSEQAHRLYMQQLDLYDRLFDTHPDKFSHITTRPQMEDLLNKWENGTPSPTGFVTLMEGADGVRNMHELEEWWQRGVRIIGPAWRATRYTGGTGEPGPLTAEGRELLKTMAPMGFILDFSHMAWEAAREALDLYEGNLIASHSNALKQVHNGKSNRFLPDEVIDGIVEHQGVIGIVPFNKFLIEGWLPPDPRSQVPISMIADQMDYICQRAGSARHVAFGTDFDGGFGLQHIPDGMDTIADLHKVAPILSSRGYTDQDIEGIFGGNWIEVLRRSLP